MMESYSLEGLKARLTSDAKAIDQMINCIPAKFYNEELVDEAFIPKSKYIHGKRKPNKAELKKKLMLSKKIKFDPEEKTSTVDLIEKKKKEKKEQESDEDSELEDESEQEETDEEDNEDVEDRENIGVDFESEAESEKETNESNKNAKIIPFSNKNKKALLEKLHNQIEAKRKQRKADEPSKIQKTKARREKKNKKAIEEKKAKATASIKIAPEKVVVDEKSMNFKTTQKSADQVKMDAEVSFSKFEFEGVEKKKKGPSTAHNLLQKIEADNRKIEAIKAKDQEKAKEIIEKNAWKKAIQLASGEKIKDDPRLLKKTIKREKQAKNKSTKEWNDRKKKVVEDEKAKQAKRTENIQKRIEAKKNKKLGIKPKSDNKAKGKGKGKSGLKGKK